MIRWAGKGITVVHCGAVHSACSRAVMAAQQNPLTVPRLFCASGAYRYIVQSLSQPGAVRILYLVFLPAQPAGDRGITMNENNSLKLQDYIKPFIFGTVSGTVLILVLFALFAVAITKFSISAGILSLLVVIAGGLGAFLAGYIASRAIGRKGLVIGLVSGVIFVVILAISSLASAGSFGGGQSLTKFIVILAAAALGGVLGVNSKKSRR